MKLFLSLLPLGLFAQLNIAVTYPYIGDLTKKIGGEHVHISTLSKGNWDPHFVVPKPSLISKVRRADGLIINGGELEIGWLPPLVSKAGNRKISKESKYYLDLSQYIDFLNKPDTVCRGDGDVHPSGNPHYHLDPNNILYLAFIIKTYLSALDSDNKKSYEENFIHFSTLWKKKLTEWKNKMQDKKGIKIIQYHDILAYFTKVYGLETLATIEPLPGISPSSRHIVELVSLMKKEKASYILHDVYHSTRNAKYLESKTGVPLVVIPHDVGALESIQDLESLFDNLTSAIK